ncbi:hypothetical protein CJA_2883 [Cellvibrio japonicus Ueda107]|uniref:Uncharacterized protein n=1 Tax=Cellvibrio japonicus (strain Ueda107) TaxID=498211 RepID=B3PC69_CELJU|nr:hypothetical protein CJA_2883 [Cellvibrio japonicus Ueda107]
MKYNLCIFILYCIRPSTLSQQSGLQQAIANR